MLYYCDFHFIPEKIQSGQNEEILIQHSEVSKSVKMKYLKSFETGKDQK